MEEELDIITLLKTVKKLKAGLSGFRLYKRKVERRVNYNYNLNETNHNRNLLLRQCNILLHSNFAMKL